jgi:hypothetical protein
MRLLSLVVFFIILLGGCSSKQYFEPAESEWSFDKEVITTSDYIKNFNSNGATTDNDKVLNKFGISEFSIPEGYEFLNYTKDGDIIVANNKGDILFVNEKKQFNLDKNIIAATKDGNLLAVIFANNTTAIYDIETKQYKFKKYAKQSFANDMRIASPLFVKDFILFPTLDGRIIVVSPSNFSVINTITVDPNNDIKNIILLKIINDTIVAASSNRLVTINNGKLLKQDSFIQSYLIDDSSIYIATVDGRIIKYNLNLQALASKKFRFAKIQALAIDKDKNIYGMESAGYLIKLSNDFSKTTVYNFPYEDDEMIYVNRSKIYFENKVLDLNK